MSADDNELAFCFFAVLRDRLALSEGTARDAAAVCAGALRSEAVPASVITRLDIERGGLELVDPYSYLDNDDLLYRVVES